MHESKPSRHVRGRLTVAGLFGLLIAGGCGEIGPEDPVGVGFRNAAILLFDPCQHAPRFSNCEVVDGQVALGWMTQLSQGWMADPPAVCLQMKSALDNVIDFGEIQLGDRDSPGLYGLADLGGERTTLDRDLNFTDGVINQVGLFTFLHESLHMAGYSHNNPQHPNYLTPSEFNAQVQSCNGVGTPPPL